MALGFAVQGIAMHAGQLLLGCHGYEPVLGKWAFPGGGMEPGELPQQALVREIREELGVIPSVLGLIGINHWDLGVLYIFGIEVESDRIKPDGKEITEAVWLTRDQLYALNQEKLLVSSRDWWIAEHLFRLGHLPKMLPESHYRSPKDARDRHKSAELYLSFPNDAV